MCILLLMIQVRVRSDDKQRGSIFSIVFSLVLERSYFYEKELSESPDERYLFFYALCQIITFGSR